MTEQERNALIEEVRRQMTGDLQHDTALLQDEVRRMEREGTDKEAADALLELAYGMLPDEQRDYLEKTMFLDGRRLNQVYAQAADLMTKKKTAEAIALSRQLYEHILMHFRETDTQRFFSFRNPLESNLYQLLYNPTKTLLQAPFDLAQYIGAHAYNLVEAGRAGEAIPVLKEAIRYNPVAPDARFELAEVYKLTGETDELFEAIMDTLPLCMSGYAIGRCYANLGFWCVETEDYDSAVRFYYESLHFADHPAIAAELKHIETVSRKPLIPPTKEMINEAFAKYQIYHGPGQEVLHVARELAKQAEEAEKWREAAYYLNIVVSLIHDEDAAKRLAHAIELGKPDEAEV